MSDFLAWLFSWICGQNPEHTWAPAGELLPMCQRCTGFYAGVAIALLLLLCFRPRLDSRFRSFHTVLVLAMAPFGFHLVSHGSFVRTLSGVWFGFGVVGLLWLLPGKKFTTGKRRISWTKHLHLILGMSSFILLPAFASYGGEPAAVILPWIAFSGLVALVGLLVIDAALFISWLSSPFIRCFRREAA